MTIILLVAKFVVIKTQLVWRAKTKLTGICLTEWPKKRKVSQNHKTHFIPVFIS